MSDSNQGYNRGGFGGQQWRRGQQQGPTNDQNNYHKQHYNDHNNSRQNHQPSQLEQSWPRQQQLPNKQGSWNRDGHRNQQRRQEHNHHQHQQKRQPGWQNNSDARSKQQSQSSHHQRQAPNKQVQKQPQQQKPREFKPPPPRPNAWGEPPGRQAQQPQSQTPTQTQSHNNNNNNTVQPTQPQLSLQQGLTSPANDSQQRQQEPHPPPASMQTIERRASGTVPGTMGAWSTKLTSSINASNAAASSVAGRGQKVAPVILKPEPAWPPNKKAKKTSTSTTNNKRDSGNANNNKNSTNQNNNNNSKNIHGKKPKLSNISMGDLVPNIKKIIPKDKNKKSKGNNKQSTQIRTAEVSTNTQAQRIQPVGTTTTGATSDFPALPATSNWPSLAASKPSSAAKPVGAPVVAVAKKAPPPPPPPPPPVKQGKPNNNNNNQSKKRKNQSHQSHETKKGGGTVKAKNGISNLLLGTTKTTTSNTARKPDEAHLAASFFLKPPAGKSLDPAHLQAQFGATVGGGGLMHQLQGGQVLKGRQRIKPRKKRFTALKRKILLERLRVWKELHPEEGGRQDGKAGDQSGNGGEASCTICVHGFASMEEVEDPDEYEELLDNLKDMADKMGNVRHVFIPSSSVEEENNNSSDSREHPAFVRFSTTAEAMAARGVWDGLVIGGQALKVRSLPIATTLNDASIDDGEETESAWQQACIAAERGNPDEAMEDVDSGNVCRIVLKEVLTEDDLEDDECFAESIQDIKQMVEKFGVVEDVQSKKQEGSTDVVIVYNGGEAVAKTALEELQHLTLGGSQLVAEILPSRSPEQRPPKLLLENILTEDDLEDAECLEESLNDIKSLLGKFGTVVDAEPNQTQIVVTFSGMTAEALRGVATEINGTCLGGQTVKASVVVEKSTTVNDLCVLLRNLLTTDDLEDDDCLEESLGDVTELARQYGSVQKVEVERGDDVASSVVKVTYSTVAEAKLAVKHFEGMIVGGETISASMSSNAANSMPDTTDPVTSDNDDKSPSGEDGEPKALFSGDKRIPERFAACKRVPKVPNKGTPRNYAILTNNDTVKPLLLEMLTELMRLQLRALHAQNAKNSKARRRVVIGLREVARGIRANKVKLVVMANNLDEYGAIDDKLQEILDLAAEKEIPVLFELSKRVLGKALGKKIKVSVCAVQATDGAHQQYAKLAALAPHLEKPPPAE